MTTTSGDPIAEALDEAPLSMFHLKSMVTAGMGFVTDSYDLNIIALALLFVKPMWHLNSGQVGLLGSTALFAAFVGAFLFGRLADLLGRKRIYGLEALLMVIGCLGSAFAPDYHFLIASRFVMGIGIGGDYPISSVLMTEFANKRSRGRQVGLMFTGYTVGSILGTIVTLALVGAGIKDDTVWRLMLGFGALPAASVLYNRRRMPESPRFVSSVMGDSERATKDLARYTAGEVKVDPQMSEGRKLGLAGFLGSRRFQILLLGTAGTWFFSDIAGYGNSISAPLIYKGLAPHAALLTIPAVSLIVSLLTAVPGLILTLGIIDHIGHRTLQLWSCALEGLGLALIGFIPGLTHTLWPFVITYGAASFFGAGWGVTTIVYPGEVYPVSARTTGHGLSAGMAKFGAFFGALYAATLLKHLGLAHTELIAAGCYVAGAACTLVLPEPSRKALAEAPEVNLRVSEPQRQPVGVGSPTT